ncbi:MAG: hypothetical protein L0Y73_05105, partial [Candidatus Aminicenantes bacterium]|nr:hypothetical protein [Candidatus Aminicenantes bacterium]
RQYNCLATGCLLEARKGDRNVYKYASKNAKGISLVIGDFESIKKIEARLPIHIFCSDFTKRAKHFRIAFRKEHEIQYGSKLDMLRKYFNFKKLKEALDFFLEKFGDLDVPEIGFLFKRGLQESGLSEKGLIIYSFNPDQSLGEKINRDNPILLGSDSTNYLIHELAHQWWGGLISWKSYRDVWITEGLAQFSVILFLEKKLPAKEIDNIIKRMKRWIFKNSDVGPVIYGDRIIGIENDYIAYQSIVYNKTALIFFMLKDILGEEEFLKRLKNTLEKLKYKSVPSATFIKTFSEGSDTAARFLTNWLNVRRLPEIDLHAVLEGKKARLVFEQPDDHFIFPIKIEIKTAAGSTTKQLIIKEKRTVLDIAEESEIKSIDVDDSRTLVKIKLQK